MLKQMRQEAKQQLRSGGAFINDKMIYVNVLNEKTYTKDFQDINTQYNILE